MQIVTLRQILLPLPVALIVLLLTLSAVSGVENTLIRFTDMPAYGENGYLKGKVENLPPEQYGDYQIAVYIRVAGGYYNKPLWDPAATTINTDGTWSTNVTTQPNDSTADQFAAFLLPDTVSPYLHNGESQLDPSLFNDATAYLIQDRPGAARTLNFAGREWRVRTGFCETDGPQHGPGPNHWCGGTDDAWVDADGLHLAIRWKADLGFWSSVEVETDVSGCGEYRYDVDGLLYGSVGAPIGTLDDLDPNAVLGLFTYSQDDDQANHEIDIEISRWGANQAAPNLHYTTWEIDASGSLQQNSAEPTVVTFNDTLSMHVMNWQESSAAFQSIQFNGPDAPDTLLQQKTLPAPSCPAETITARINFWLNDGQAPVSNTEQEVVIKNFAFMPAKPVPTAPSGLTLSVASASQIDLSWTDTSNNETAFDIERKTENGAFVTIATVGGNATTYADTGLDPATTYTYRVRATGQAGGSTYSNEAAATTVAPTLSTIHYAFGGGAGYVLGHIQNMPAGAYYVRTWVKTDIFYHQGVDAVEDSAGDFTAPGLWGSPGVDIWVTLHPAASDPWTVPGSEEAGGAEDLPSWNWPAGLGADAIVFGPFSTQ